MLLSLRNVALQPTADRFRFTVHSQPLAVMTLLVGERRRQEVRSSVIAVPPLSPPLKLGGAEAKPAAGLATSEPLLPFMHFYEVRVPVMLSPSASTR